MNVITKSLIEWILVLLAAGILTELGYRFGKWKEEEERTREKD